MEQMLKSFEFFHDIIMVYYSGASEETMKAFRDQLEVETDNNG